MFLAPNIPPKAGMSRRSPFETKQGFVPSPNSSSFVMGLNCIGSVRAMGYMPAAISFVTFSRFG